MPTAGTILADACARLRSGGVVAFPTETVYGLGADALNSLAVARVFALKSRPWNNPLIVHAADTAMAQRCVSVWSDDAERLAAAFWPGPLSIVLPKASNIPPIVTGGGDGVAVRCPDHPLTLELLHAFGSPLVGPSANPSGRVSPTTAKHVRASFAEADVLVLDGGACVGGIESTVVDVRPATPRVLRPGLIGADDIARVLGRHVEHGIHAAGTGGDPAAALPSPGLLRSHYAPRTPAVLADASDLAAVASAASGGVVVITIGPDGAASLPSAVARITLPADARGYARGLYAALRRADAAGIGLIVIERPAPSADAPDAGVWSAVLDRLDRATAR